MTPFRTFFVLLLALLLLTGCGGSGSRQDSPAPLSANDINLVFVLSQDLTYSAPGDIDPSTANLTNQGLQRSLMMAGYLKRQVLGNGNASGIYVIEPMTHLQTASNYPDLASMGAIQGFAMLNQTAQTTAGAPPVASFALNASYALGAVLPTGVVAPFAPLPCPACQGLDFGNSGGSNDALLAAIADAKAPGFYVFSAPWATTSAMLVNLNKRFGGTLSIPQAFAGPNRVYTVSINSSGKATLQTYDSRLNPPSGPVVLPAALPRTACTAQSPFSFSITAGQPFRQTLNGVTTTGTVNASTPSGISTNETIYMIRHVEAHPTQRFENGNHVAAGQWRALGLADALRGKISPDMVYSIDPAQVLPGSGGSRYSYVRTTLTAEPYAIANKLPFYLAASFSLNDILPTGPNGDIPAVVNTNNYFFTGGRFANRKILLVWEHAHLPYTLNDLLKRYFPNGGGPALDTGFWPEDDYDTIWTVSLDAQGNLSADNALCEGIASAQLPATAPQF